MFRAASARGEIVWADAGAPPWPWWSLTKTALAAAAMVLVQRGRLAMDAPIDREPFSLRQLLQHTSGLPDYGGLAEYHAAVAAGEPPWPFESLLERAEARRLRFRPGERFAYSNIGYARIGRLIERACDAELGGALRQLVFDPLGLDGVRMATEPGDAALAAAGAPAGYHPGWVYHGLAVGTPADAARFVDRLLGGGGLLSSETLALATRPVTVADAALAGRPWHSAGYGLGLMIDAAFPGGRALGHTGGGPGSATAAWRFEREAGACAGCAFARTDDPGTVERAAIEAALGARAAR